MDNNPQLEADMTCQIEAFTKSLTLKIAGCSLARHIKFDVGMVIAKFDLGGHTWAVNFSPNSGYSRLSVSLLTKTTTEMALEIEFSLPNFQGMGDSVGHTTTGECYGTVKKQGDSVPVNLNVTNMNNFRYSLCRIYDCIMLKFSVRLFKPLCSESGMKKVVVPASMFYQSNLYQHYLHLWEAGDGADVAFKVCEEIITAHRNVLVARSPVFRAQFFSSMIESKTECIIKVEDMKPEVFKLVLQFIYTDNLPPQKELSPEMAQHLLVAADRYGVERLKLICEEKLSANLSIGTAATTLMLAEQHNCEKLKEICIDFVASRENLQAVLATDGFSYLIESCPIILKDLLANLDCDRSN